MVSGVTVVTGLMGRMYNPRMLRKPTAGCLFSGMGGFASGLVAAGFEVRWANDNDPHASDTFRHRFPGVRFIPGDVQKVRTEDLESVDVLAGGFPCQSFSQAGDRRGFDDPRGEMFFQIPRLLKEWMPHERPKLVLLENVPYLRYGARGAWFNSVRRALRQAGYWFRAESCWVANVREWTGIPQDRERLFLVAASREHFTYNPFTPPKLDHAKACERTIHDIVDRTVRAADGEYLPVGNKYRGKIEEQMAVGQSPENLYQVRRNYVREKPDALCPTLTANMGIGGHNVPFLLDEWGIRRLSVKEVASLQGFDHPETALFPETVPSVERYRLLGNAACPGLAHIVGVQCLVALREHRP